MKRPLLFIFLFCFAVQLLAQTDTVEQGVIHVRRPPEPAKFTATFQYYYADYGLKNTRIKKFSKNEILLSDSVPGRLSAQAYDINSSTRQGEELMNYLRHSYPQEPFDWEKYLSTIDFTFAWDDSTRLDSARFRFDVAADGKVSGKLVPWKNADKETRTFESKVDQKLATCNLWFPARINTGKKRKKTKNVASTVLVTVYAHDAMEGRMKPLKVVNDPK